MGYVQLVKLPKRLGIYVAVGIGGVIGSCLRYLVSILFITEGFSSFPWATLIVNLSGAFLLTFILFLPFVKNKLSPVFLTAITTGMIGSYTTFSAIMIELVMLWENNLGLAIVYLLLTFAGGLLCSYSGYKIAGYFKIAGLNK